MASQTSKHIRTGKDGERKAAVFLQQLGYTVLQLNYRYKRAEVDIIAKKDDVLVFVEVKTRASDRYGLPEEAVTPQKERLIMSAAEEYIYEINWQHDIRFDIISITLGTPLVIHHIEDAFH